MSTSHWFTIGLVSALNLAAIGGIQLLRRWIQHAEVTRKLAHVASGLLGLLLPRWFPLDGEAWPLFILWMGFSAFLYLTYRKKILNAINGIERKSTGAYIMPTAIIAQWFFGYTILHLHGNYSLAMYDIPLLILTFGDPMAAMMGTLYGTTTIHAKTRKTWVGFGSIATVSFLLFMLYNTFASTPLQWLHTTLLQTVGIGCAAGLTAALAEAFTSGGWDNFAIPTTVLMVLLLFS